MVVAMQVAGCRQFAVTISGQLAFEIERKNDLGELTLGIGAPARVTARQHDIVEVDQVLAERRDVHDASRLAKHHDGQQNPGE
jgi:hypothetical protein